MSDATSKWSWPLFVKVAARFCCGRRDNKDENKEATEIANEGPILHPFLEAVKVLLHFSER